MGVRNTGEVIIERNAYGEGEREVEVCLGNDEVILFTVGEQEYTKEELEEVFAEGFRWARQNMLNENSSANEVRTSLEFMTEVPGGIIAEWISSNPELLDVDGTLHNGDMAEEESQTVMVSLILTCQEETQMEDIYLNVKGPVLSKSEKVKERIQAIIAQKEAETRTESAFSLPQYIEGVKISTTPAKNPGGIIIIVAAAGLFLVARRQNMERNLARKRQRQIQEDYPVFVNKLMLYLGAGLPLKAAFQVMLDEHMEDCQDMSVKPRYIYEELFITMNEMKAGTAEREAYEAFGNRVKDNNYIRMMALLVQNLQKGNDGLIKSLSDEEEMAFRRRIEQAKKEGEEAGTKLLFPMLLLLIVVMMIVMAPAVLQFQGY